MMDNASLRRWVTVPSVALGFLLVTALAPLLLPFAAIVDLIRWLLTRTPWMATRMFTFLWVFLLGDVWRSAPWAR